MSRIPFNLSRNLGDADLRVDIEQEMDVIRHNCHPEHTIVIGLSLLQDQLLESGIQRRIEHLAPILRTQNYMVLAVINDGVIGVIFFG